VLGGEIVVRVGPYVEIEFGGLTIVVPADCPTGGPPRPFPPASS
jgi:hypothetical protein